MLTDVLMTIVAQGDVAEEFIRGWNESAGTPQEQADRDLGAKAIGLAAVLFVVMKARK